MLMVPEDPVAGGAPEAVERLDRGLVHEGGPHNALIERAAAARAREMVAFLLERYDYRLGDDLHAFADPRGEHDEVSWGRRLPRVLEAFLPRPTAIGDGLPR